MDDLRTAFNENVQLILERSFPELSLTEVLRNIQLGISEEKRLITFSASGATSMNLPLMKELRVLIQNFSFYNGHSYEVIELRSH